MKRLISTLALSVALATPPALADTLATGDLG